MPTPGAFGNSFADALRHYLQQNSLKQSQLTHSIVSELAERHYAHFQQITKAKKRKADATPEEIAIYEAYPKKVARSDALRAIAGALRTIGPQELFERTSQFARCVARWPASYRFKDGRDLCPHPATWFNSGRFSDDSKEWLPAGMFTREDDPKREMGMGESGPASRPLLEPAGWLQEFPDSTQKDWALLDRTAQNHICQHMKKLHP